MEQMHPGLVIECTVLQATGSLISVMFKVNDSDVFTGALIRSPPKIPRILNPDLTEQNEKYTTDEREQMANEIMRKYPRGIGRLRMADPRRMLFRQLLELEKKIEQELPKIVSQRGRKPMATGKKRGRKPKCQIKPDTNSSPKSINNPDCVHAHSITKDDAFQLENDAIECDNKHNRIELGKFTEYDKNNPHLTLKNKLNDGLMVVKQKRGRKPKNLKNIVSTSDAAELNKVGNSNGEIATSNQPIDTPPKKKRGRKPKNRDVCHNSETDSTNIQPAIDFQISVPYEASTSTFKSQDPLRIFASSNGPSPTISNGTVQLTSPHSGYATEIFSKRSSSDCDNMPDHNGTCISSDDLFSKYRMFIHPYTNQTARRLSLNGIHQPCDYDFAKPNNFPLSSGETENKLSYYNSVPIEKNGLSHFSDCQQYQYEINNRYSHYYYQTPSYDHETRSNHDASSFCAEPDRIHPSPSENAIESNNADNGLGNESSYGFNSFCDTNERCNQSSYRTHESTPTFPETSPSVNHLDNSYLGESDPNSAGDGMITQSPDDNCCSTPYLDSSFSIDRENNNNTPTCESCNESKMTPPCSYHCQDMQAEASVNDSHDQNGSDEIRSVSPGNVVWGKLYNHPWWPAEIVTIFDHSPDNPIASVRWFGTNILSVVFSQYLLPFTNYSVEEMCGSNLTDALLDATVLAKMRNSECTTQAV